MRASFVARVCVLRSNVRMTCPAHSNESCHAYECATPHLRMSRDRLSYSLCVCLEEQCVNDVCVVSLMNAASHTWIRHVWMRHATCEAGVLKCVEVSALCSTAPHFFPSCTYQPGVLQCVEVCCVVRCSALQCRELQHHRYSLQHTAIHSNFLQQTAIHRNTLQNTANHSSTLQRTL